MLNDKAQLRKIMKEKRAFVSNREERNAEILSKFFSLSEVINAKNIFIYASIGTEADTWGIIKKILLQGKNVFLPRVEGKNMVFVRYNGQPLPIGRFQIPEPQGKSTKICPDVVVLPLLAINSSFHRLGYGGGYYDRFLKDKPNVCKIGIGFSFQKIQENFAEKFDIPADIFVSDSEIIYLNKAHKE